MNHWDSRFLEVAQMISTWSKDPSTQVGAVIVDSKRRVCGSGYNGFPRGVQDTHERLNERTLKHEIVVHAEVNAILNAAKNLEGCTLYSTFFPCPRCAAVIIQSGITRVVAPSHKADERYKHLFEISQVMFEEAGVSYERIIYEGQDSKDADLAECRGSGKPCAQGDSGC